MPPTQHLCYLKGPVELGVQCTQANNYMALRAVRVTRRVLQDNGWYPSTHGDLDADMLTWMLTAAATIATADQETLQSPPPSPVGSQHSSAHSKTPHITHSMDFSSGKGVVRVRRGQQLEFALADVM